MITKQQRDSIYSQVQGNFTASLEQVNLYSGDEATFVARIKKAGFVLSDRHAEEVTGCGGHKTTVVRWNIAPVPKAPLAFTTEHRAKLSMLALASGNDMIPVYRENKALWYGPENKIWYIQESLRRAGFEVGTEVITEEKEGCAGKYTERSFSLSPKEV